MPWQANNNQPGEYRAPSVRAYQQNRTCEEKDGVQKKVFHWRVQQLAAHATRGDWDFVQHCVYLNPKSFQKPEETAIMSDRDSHKDIYVYPRENAQFVSLLRLDERVPEGIIFVPEIQLINYEICDGEMEKWSLYQTIEPCAISCTIEVRPFPSRSTNSYREEHLSTVAVPLQARDIESAFAKAMWHRIVTEYERCIVRLSDNKIYFVRIVEIEAPDKDEDEFTMPDIFRALMDEDTIVYSRVDPSVEVHNFLLEGIRKKPKMQIRPDVVFVHTNDEEEFPVKKKLLFPCIKLSSAVLSGKGVHKEASTTISVDVDCCTFDRVLLYLEHEAHNDGENFKFDPLHLEAIMAAAKTLGCIGLEEVCAKRLGEFDSRVRKHAIQWEEVLSNNATGNVWLVMDGMVFDVTRWLPEHPGGSTIIPRDALNLDCTVMFEIFHSSRQSFRYLKQFYIGEISNEDKKKVPPSKDIPSEAFIEELRQYTTWRITPTDKVHKSF